MSILPESIFERFRMSAMIFSRASPLELIISTCSRWSRVRVVEESIFEKPTMALIGVRSSWLTIARNSDLARSAASAASLARRSAASASLRSVMSWPTAWYSIVVPLVVLDRPLGPADPEAPAVVEGHLGLEGVRLVRDRRARREVGEVDAHQLVALAVHRARIGAVHERDLAVVPVAADEVGLVLDDPLVARLDLLERAGHALDLAGEADDLVRVRLVPGHGRVLDLAPSSSCRAAT